MPVANDFKVIAPQFVDTPIRAAQAISVSPSLVVTTAPDLTCIDVSSAMTLRLATECHTEALKVGFAVRSPPNAVNGPTRILVGPVM